MMTTITTMTTTTTTRTIENNTKKRVAEGPNPFNTWFAAPPTSSSPSTQSSSGVSSSNTFCHNSPVPRIKLSDHFAPQPNHRPNFISDEYLRLMQQDISFYQSMRTDQCWIRLRKNLEDQQILGFIEWMNQQFSSSSLSSFRSYRVDSDITDVVKYPIRSLSDLHDGLPLIFLLECLYNCAPLKKELKCRLRLHKVKNFETCLSFMRVSRHCECVGIQAYDLAGCVNVKIMLGFLFLIKHDYEHKYLNEIAAVDNHVDNVVTASVDTVDTAAGVEMMNASLLSDEIKDSSVSVEEEVDEDESDHSHYHLDHENEQHVDEQCIQTEGNKNEEMSTMTSSVNEMSGGLNMGLEHDESGIMTIGTCTASNVTMTAVDGNDMSFEDSSSTSSTSSSVFSLTSETLPTSSSILLDAQKEPNNNDDENNTNNKDLTSTYSSVIETYDMSSESSNELDYDEDDRDRAVTPVLVDQENKEEEKEETASTSSDNRPRLSSFTIDSFLDDEQEKTNIESEKNDQEQETNSKEEPTEKTDIVEVVEASNSEPSELEIVKTPIDLEHSNDDNKELVELVEISSSSLNNVDEPAGELLELEEASAKEEFVSEELIEEVVVSDILPISQHLQQVVEDVVVEPIECAKVVEITLNGSDIKVATTASNETDSELSRPEPVRREPVEIERLTNGDNSFNSTIESNGSVIKIPLNVTKRGGRKPPPPHHKTLKMSLEVKAVEKPAQKVVANVETESSKVQISKLNVEVVNKEVVVEKVEKVEKKKEIEPTETQTTKTKNLVKNGGPKIAEAPILPSSIMKKPTPPSDDDKLEQQKNGGEKIPKIKKDADNKKEKPVDKIINTNQTVEKKANKKKVAFASAATSSKKEEENHSSNHNGNSQTNGKMNGHSEKKEKVESKSKSTAVISKYWKPSSILITVLIATIYYFISSQD